MKVFVTGCAGMIGSSFSETLLKKGHDVVGCDNFFRGTQQAVDHIMAIARKEQSTFNFYEIDLTEGLPIRLLEGVDAVVHLADVVGGVKYVFENEFQVFNLNVIIDANVSQTVVESGIKKYLYAATACSFPHFLQASVDSVIFEKDKFPAEPESAYGWSKLVGELQAIYLGKLDSVECARVIFHNVYGRWCDFNPDTAQVIPALISKASQLEYGEAMEVWGDGKQVRSFINSRDIANSMLSILESNRPLSFFDSIQLGATVGTPIDDLAKIILDEMGRGSTQIQHNNPSLKGDTGRLPDLSLSKRAGLIPEVGLRDGIRDLIEWAREHGHVRS